MKQQLLQTGCAFSASNARIPLSDQEQRRAVRAHGTPSLQCAILVAPDPTPVSSVSRRRATCSPGVPRVVSLVTLPRVSSSLLWVGPARRRRLQPKETPYQAVDLVGALRCALDVPMVLCLLGAHAVPLVYRCRTAGGGGQGPQGAVGACGGGLLDGHTLPQHGPARVRVGHAL